MFICYTKREKTYTNKLLCLITVLLRKNTTSPKALRQLHLRAVRQEDCVKNSSEESCEEQEWLIQLKDTFLGKIEVLNP